MSTILKALRRLEDQKADAAPRPLRDEVVLTPSRGRTRRGLGVALAASLALAITGALALAFLDFSAPPEPVESEAPPAVSSPPDDAVAAVEAAPAQEEPPASGAGEPDVAAAMPASPPDFEIVRPDPAATARPLAPPPLPRIEDEEPGAAEPSRAVRAPVELPVYEEEPLEEAPVPRAAVRASASLRVARTQWHPSPDRRLAWVEVDGMTALREVREGERVGPYLVREIEPAGVVFADGSVELRREVGR